MARDRERRGWQRGKRKSSLPLPGCNTVCAGKELLPPLLVHANPTNVFQSVLRGSGLQTMCRALESGGGDSQILWLIALIPGLSLVILRQIIQDYVLMGCVKSAGKHKWGWVRRRGRGASVCCELQFKFSLCEVNQLTACRLCLQRECLTPPVSQVRHV